MKVSIKLLWALGGLITIVGGTAALGAMTTADPSPCPPMCPSEPGGQTTEITVCGGACDPSVGVVCGGGLECISGYCLNDEICEPVETVDVCLGACDPAVGVMCGEGLDCVSGVCLGQSCYDDEPMNTCGAACDPDLGINCGAGLQCESGYCVNDVICNPSVQGNNNPPPLMPTATPNQSLLQPPPEINPVLPPVPNPVAPVSVPPPSCVDDGVCTVAEQGIGSCRDCSANPGDSCGVACNGTCGGGLSCVNGFCWDAAVCDPDGGDGGNQNDRPEDEPVCSCDCVRAGDSARCTDSCSGAACTP